MVSDDDLMECGRTGQPITQPDAKYKAKGVDRVGGGITKDKVRELTKRNRGRSLKLVMKELDQILRGWANYFKRATNQSLWIRLDA